MLSAGFEPESPAGGLQLNMQPATPHLLTFEKTTDLQKAITYFINMHSVNPAQRPMTPTSASSGVVVSGPLLSVNHSMLRFHIKQPTAAELALTERSSP